MKGILRPFSLNCEVQFSKLCKYRHHESGDVHIHPVAECLCASHWFLVPHKFFKKRGKKKKPKNVKKKNQIKNSHSMSKFTIPGIYCFNSKTNIYSYRIPQEITFIEELRGCLGHPKTYSKIFFLLNLKLIFTIHIFTYIYSKLKLYKINNFIILNLNEMFFFL